ncbi:MAG: putative Ig domain-containing protein [Acidobacteria bacterium]|nr:putative Ig domain-containing protein [Acidobacteriota bacterium]
MNLQRIKQVAVCTVMVALGLTGAGLFPTHPVAGQEPRPGALHGAAALDQLKQDGQYESLQAAIRQARFSVSRAENTPLRRAAWHAPNPAAGYDAYVTEAGVSIALNDQSYVSLSLHSLGYGASMQVVAPGEVSGDKQTINLARDNGVQEWYVNGPEGLEQGFTLAEPPGGRHPAVPLRLALRVSAGWRAVASEDGKAVTLRGAVAAVEYGKLVVSDSLGRSIPARLTVAEEMVVIEAEDSEATYPLTIDPIFTLQQKMLAADGANIDHFGSAVALYGDTVAVGAEEDDIGTTADQGSVYVFTRSGATWSLQQKITAFDGAVDDLFGTAVALYGDTLAVGATTRGYRAGSAYVFTRSGATWTLQQKITAFDGAVSNIFGCALALSDYTMVVGAFGANIGANIAQGAVYVYTRIGATWTLQKKIIAGDGAADDFFGIAVALNVDTLAVGARRDDVGTNQNQGSVYVFQRFGTVWLIEQRIFANDGAADDLFGTAVALSGDTLAVGASRGDVSGIADQGSAYVFTRGGGVWTQQQKLTADDGAMFDHFGDRVALNGDTVLVGVQDDDIGASANQGSAYVFTRTGGVWTQQHKLTAFDGAAGDRFGYAVALSSDTLVASAYSDDIARGSAYVYGVSYCPVLTFAPASLPNGVKGISYQKQITVSGGPGPYQFDSSSTLPPGLTLMTNGLLSGVPTTPGTYILKVRATDVNSGCYGIHKYTFEILASCPTLTIDPPALPDGAKGVPYSVALTAIGGAAPYKFSVKGKLPQGLSLNTNGVLSGTPTKAGNYKFTLMVSDAIGCTWSRADSITIKQAGIEISAAPPANDGSWRVVRSQNESLQASMRQARFSVSRSDDRNGHVPR